MAATAIVIRCRQRPYRNPAFLHSFSTSSSDPDAGSQDSFPSSPTPSSPSQSSSTISSYFSDVKASLKQKSFSTERHQLRKPFSPSPAPEPIRSSEAMEKIRKNLSEFRRRAAGPMSPENTSARPISFQELYKRNVIAKGEDSNESTKGKTPSFDTIRESLRQLQINPAKDQAARRSKLSETLSFSRFKENYDLRYSNASSKDTPRVAGGTELPASVFFGKEVGKKEESPAMKTEFLRTYSYSELGQKLKMLRPEGTKRDKWFSLGELNERLVKLREIEVKENQSRIGGATIMDLRESLVRLRISDDEQAKKTSMQRLDVLNRLSGTPSFMLSSPKEHLVEKYFHPDNMSAAEKLKIQLQNVREEFKMSESDCGSTRVQVAQLTTKIKHLSNVLAKKDKHSKKGLLAMVQKRKKLLKYLRRTDWDSYCLVLSKLGLRDKPELRN